MLTTKANERRNFYIKALIIPVIVLTAMFLILRISPFGPRNFLISDLSTQYLQFFTELRRQLLHLNFSSYSFLISIGDSVVPIYSYYLLSPLNLIIVFFKNAQLPIAIDLIIWLKLILANITMSTYLAKKYQKYDVMAIGAGVAYGLCGFVAMYFYDLMWLDALIMLPIVIMGLERLFYQDRVWLYVFSLAYTIITNYYMGYILCIFSVLYYVYLLLLNQPNKLSLKPYIKQQGRQTAKFLWYSFLAGGLSALVLVPTGIAMISTGKSDLALKNFFLKGSFGLSSLVNLGVGANNFTGRLVHDPSFFSGTVFIIAAICYFFSTKINQRSKQAAGFVLGAVFLGMWLRPLNTVWHMFQKPAGFPFRMVFVLSFLVIMQGFEAYTKGVFKDRQLIVRTTAGVAVALTVGYIFANIFGKKMQPFKFTIPQLSVSNWFLLLGIGFLALTAFLMIGTTVNSEVKKHYLVLTIMVEMVLNFLIATGGAPFTSQREYAKAYNRSEKVMAAVNSDDLDHGRAYRSVVINHPMKELYAEPYYGYNDALIFQNRGISSYSSTLNSHTHHVLASLGFSTRNIRRIDMLGGTAVSNHLLGIRNQVVIGKHRVKVHKNPQVAPIGFMVNDGVQNLTFEKNMIFNNLNRLVQTEAGKNKQYFKAPQIMATKSNYRRGTYNYTLKIKSRVTGPQYLYIPSKRLYGVTVSVNGRKLSSIYSGLGTEVLPLGTKKMNQPFVVRVTSTYELAGLASDFSGMNGNAFKRDVLENPTSTFEFDEPEKLNYQGSNFKGNVNVIKDHQTLLLSMPFDKGWHVTVNDKPHQILKVADGLMGIKLTPGEKQLHFRYEAAGLGLGRLLTGIAVVLMLITAGVRIKKRKM